MGEEESKAGAGAGGASQDNMTTILLGDVGGTNIRLVLKQIDLRDPDTPGKVIKDGKQLSQLVKTFEEAVANFLNEYKDTNNWP